MVKKLQDLKINKYLTWTQKLQTLFAGEIEQLHDFSIPEIAEEPYRSLLQNKTSRR